MPWPRPLFQRGFKCEATDMKMIFYSHANKNHFHNLALSLVLKVRVFGTRKWSLVQIYLIVKLFQVLEIWLLLLAFYQESTRGVKPTRNWIMFLMSHGRIYCLSSCFEHILLFRAIMREFKCAIQI